MTVFGGTKVDSAVVLNAQDEGPTSMLTWKSTVMSITPQNPPNRINVKVTIPLKVRPKVLKKQAHFCCIRGGPGGIWVVERVVADGRELHCRSAVPTETGKFEWEISPGVDGENMIVHNVSTSETAPIEMAFVTPLNFDARLTLFSMFDVNTVSQMFRADARLELMLPNISDANVKREYVEEFLEGMGLRRGQHVVQFLNVVEVVDEITHFAEYVENSLQADSHMDYRLNYRIRAIFTGQFVLQAFPFDQQELTIPIQLFLPKEKATLNVNYQNPSIFQVTNFQLSNVFHVATGNYIVANALFSDINESTTSKIYPRLNFSIILQRRGGYYITHIVIPVTIITYMGFLSFCLNNEGLPMDTGERLLISLTMVLTAVTYKFVVAGAIPQISYLTMLDYYVTFSFYYVCCISTINAFVTMEHEDEHSTIVIMMIMAGVYTLYNILWAIYCIFCIRWRDHDNEVMLNYHRVRLMVAKTFPNSKAGFQGRMFAEMMKELGIKEAPIQHAHGKTVDDHKVSILQPTHHAIKKIHHSIARSMSAGGGTLTGPLQEHIQ
ncbi:Aste57867_2692 [Aphanomyces stellatus]|uniref:Aste57867_2692 protein n=1 Tax=Aphanomyces stellatus TaxID=120398 RepID=A0A485KBV5_9STRA|nr:hypothetical protein As57867_002685 [Aphanomyces stellatus]VFT79885.1 Aste57867_2692 [Aphanomyces stellatus]